MPFTGLRLKNFKCFADSGDIPLRPLTLLFGRNNSGKSSVLQA
jgi:AAA15 family ATPase/GTPase